MTIDQLLAWLVNSGGSIVVVSWLAERFPWYKEQLPNVKETMFFAACLVVSMSSYLALTYLPPETIAAISPYFTILYGTFGSLFLGNMFHSTDKKIVPTEVTVVPPVSPMEVTVVPSVSPMEVTVVYPTKPVA